MKTMRNRPKGPICLAIQIQKITKGIVMAHFKSSFGGSSVRLRVRTVNQIMKARPMTGKATSTAIRRI